MSKASELDRVLLEQGCTCARDSTLHKRLANVSINTGAIFQQALMEFGVCPIARNAALESSIITMVTNMTQYGTAIESFSQEARWKIDRVIDGIEARLKERVAAYYEATSKMTPEELRRFEDKMKEIFGEKR